MNPNVVKTALDQVVFTNYEKDPGPQVGKATDALVFNQEAWSNAAVISEVFKGVSFFDTRQEEEDVPGDTPQITDKITYSIVNYAKSIDISKNYFDDEMHSTVRMMMRDYGLKARRSQDNNAFKYVREGFDTSTTADAAYLFSDSHANINGDTIDNKGTSALGEAALNDAIVALAEQKDQAGEVMGTMPTCLLVPPKLFKKACEITDSEWRSETANNDINVYSDKYGLAIKQSPYLGAAAGGSDTAWFLLGENHNLTRWVRQPLQTDLVDYKYQRNNNYIYKGEFREVIGAITYEGLWGSTGAA
jgi:hypothetical protein